ncbi:MAG: chorismate mutase [Clostridiales bacterium]|nr:chorismate mutase [Clostridiales bacterium]
MVLAIRGATTSDGNSLQEINECTCQMMKKIIEANSIIEDDVISILFTATNDLNQLYPSVCVREILGWVNTPILNFEEKYITNSIKSCIRVMVYINSTKSKKSINHIYLKGAKELRRDLLSK